MAEAMGRSLTFLEKGRAAGSSPASRGSDAPRFVLLNYARSYYFLIRSLRRLTRPLPRLALSAA